MAGKPAFRELFLSMHHTSSPGCLTRPMNIQLLQQKLFQLVCLAECEMEHEVRELFFKVCYPK